MHKIHESLLTLAVQISTLNHDPANARKHGARNLEAVKASLAKFGQRTPLVVQRQGMVVRAGNARLDAAKALGWTEIAAIVVDEGDVEATAYAIADNRTAELAEWDEPVLSELLTSMQLDLTFATGFDTAEIAKLAKTINVRAHDRTVAAPLTDPDEIPEEKIEPTTRPGDLWLLGPHKLLCGDSTKPEDVARVMGSEKAVLCATDPPYGIAYDNQDRGGDAAKKPAIANDDLVDGAALQAFLEAAIRAAVPHLDERAAFYLWHPMLTQGTFFAAAAAAAADVLIHRQIIWVKPSLILGRGDYHWRHELCFYGWRRGFRPPFYGERNQDTVWSVAGVSRAERKEMNHLTPKPVALWDRPIANHTLPGEILYEPFAGSGTQIIAAQITGRRCFAIELDPANCDISVRRWERLAGGKAERRSE